MLLLLCLLDYSRYRKKPIGLLERIILLQIFSIGRNRRFIPLVIKSTMYCSGEGDIRNRTDIYP